MAYPLIVYLCVIMSIVFPLRIRSAAVSIGTLANFTSNLLVAFLFEQERLTLVTVQLLVLICICSFLPELILFYIILG